jgi:hypothetical protein
MPQPAALQRSRQDQPRDRSGPDKSFTRERNLNDRPAWAREQREAGRSSSSPTPQSESRTVRIPVRQRDTERNLQEDRGSAAPQSESPNATTGFNELRRESTQPGRSRTQGSDSMRERERREETRAFSGQSARPANEARELSRRPDRAPSFTPPPQQAMPPMREPREMPQPRVREQPAVREQPRPERSFERATPPEPRREQFRSEQAPQRAAPAPRSETPSRSQGPSRSSSEGRSGRALHNDR